MRRTALVLVTAGLMAGCSAPLTEPEARPSRFVEEPEVSVAAREAYGPAAGEAYDELVAFVLDESLVRELLDAPREEITADQLNEEILERFAPESRPGWEERVADALAGDAAAQGDVQVLRPHDLQAPEGVGLTPGDPVRSQVITEAFVDVGEEPGEMAGATSPGGDVASATASMDRPLSVAFRHRAVIELRGRGGSTDVELDRLLSFEVVPADPSTDGVSWLIRSYEGDLTLTLGQDELRLTDDEATTSVAPGSG